MTPEEAQLLFRVLNKLGEGIGHIAPGSYGDFYAEFNEAFILLKSYGAIDEAAK